MKKNRILFVVDMINGFVKQGALHDESILGIVGNIQHLASQFEQVVFVADCHDEKASEFETFPPHCIKGSFESEIIDELKPFVKEQVIYKNSTNTMWAMDYKTRLRDVNEVVLVGCCTDICILHFALSLKTYMNQENRDCNVIVVSDAVATYNAVNHDAKKYSQMALELMALASVSLITTQEIE